MICKLSLLFLFFKIAVSTFVLRQRFPDSVQRCIRNATREPVDQHRAERACIMAYYDEESGPKELTMSDKEFFQKRVDSRFGFVPPKSGLRIRRELRTLTEHEWNRLVSVLQTMYKQGTIHRFGRLHGQTKKQVHKGAAFLPWHRIFILDFEEEMRRIDDRVFLPYWDYTIDSNITPSSDSIVWSECFFGNGNGIITSGPFTNFYGGHSIQLLRDIERTGKCPPRLINRNDVEGIMRLCYFENITTGAEPFFQNVHNIEMLHDEVHDWVGGDMDELPFAAFDPVFYMHHAFIDFIWEKFRIHQQNRCKVDPETDWRPSDDLCQKGRENHGKNGVFFGYPHLRNIDGSWNNWTTIFYNYEDQPTCPDCGNSKYLYCDRKSANTESKGTCLTKRKSFCSNKRDNLKTNIEGKEEPLSFLKVSINQTSQDISDETGRRNQVEWRMEK